MNRRGHETNVNVNIWTICQENLFLYLCGCFFYWVYSSFFINSNSIFVIQFWYYILGSGGKVPNSQVELSGPLYLLWCPDVLLETVLLTWTISVSLLVFCFHLWIPSLFLLCKSLHHVPFLVQCAITINTLLCLQNKRIGKNKAGYPYWVLSSIWQDINRDNLDSNIM